MQESLKAKPTFGGRQMSQAYYQKVNHIIETTRKLNLPLSTIALMLNAVELRTPRGHEWDRTRLSAYIRHTEV